MIHEDERRILEDWPEAKIITAKKNCTLGDHYHKIKTEKFVAVSGVVFARINNDPWFRMTKGELITVNPGERHAFEMSDDAVLIGLCSHPYDSSDDYK